jgi:hypothetical protein
MHQRGFAVIPVTGKNPAIDGWQKIEATPELIKRWPKDYPFHKNTGVLTKYTPAIDIDIMDAKAADDAESLLQSFFEKCGGMISARIGMSPKRAFLFRTDKPFRKLTLKLIAPNGKAYKIEILGDGEQVVVHGLHVDTKQPYSWTAGTPWTDIRVEDLPYLDEDIAREYLHEVAELLIAEHGYKLHEEPKPRSNGGDGEPRSSDPANWGALISNIISGADLHDSIRDLACSFAATMSEQAAIARLRAIMNESRAKVDRPRDWQRRHDDIPRAVRTGMAKVEARWEQGELRREREQQEQERDQQEQAGAQPGATQHGPGGGLGRGEPPPPPPPKPDPSIPTINWHGEAPIADTRPTLIEDLFPEVGHGLLSGQWGTCKTFNALEIAHCVMTERPYLDLSVRRPGGVLFFALEGASEIAIRLQGVLDHKGDKRLERAPFAWFTHCPPLRVPRSAETIITWAKAVAEQLKTRFNLPLVLIIFDTVVVAADYLREGNDNDTVLNHIVAKNMAKIARALGCFVLGLDHYGKDTTVGTRGASVKEGDADVILATLGDRAENGSVSNLRLVFRKRRSGEAGQEFPFHKRVVSVGTNAHGKEETTLVLSFSEDPNAPRQAHADQDWGKAKAVMHLRKVVMSLMAEHGQDIHPFADRPPMRALKVELVEAEFLRSYPVPDKGDGSRPQNTRRQAFKRAIGEAVIKKRVLTTRMIHDVQWVWLNRHTDDDLEP